MKEDTSTVKKDTKSIKGVATDIKKDTESLKKNMKIVQKGQQTLKKLEKDVAEIKEHVTKKSVENTERNYLSYPEESNFSELHLIGLFCIECDEFRLWEVWSD